MSHVKKCPHGSQFFQFDFPQYSPAGEYLHTLNIIGWGCKKDGYADADIDTVHLNNVDVKPLLEVNGGMILVDQAAENHVKEMFSKVLPQAA